MDGLVQTCAGLNEEPCNQSLSDGPLLQTLYSAVQETNWSELGQ